MAELHRPAGPGPHPVVVLVHGGFRRRLAGGHLALWAAARADLPAGAPERYVLGSPAARRPLGVPTLLVHGDADESVPGDMRRRDRDAAVAAGDDRALPELPGVGHMALIDPASAAWPATAGRL